MRDGYTRRVLGSVKGFVVPVLACERYCACREVFTSPRWNQSDIRLYAEAIGRGACGAALEKESRTKNPGIYLVAVISHSGRRIFDRLQRVLCVSESSLSQGDERACPVSERHRELQVEPVRVLPEQLEPRSSL
jgi:hypothetical protein